VILCHGHVGEVKAVAWSPDSTHIVSGSADRTARVWNAASGTTSFIYRGHSHVVWNVAWSPAGKRIASASDDMTVQVWNTTLSR
jgi:WD40 repeat protein